MKHKGIVGFRGEISLMEYKVAQGGTWIEPYVELWSEPSLHEPRYKLLVIPKVWVHNSIYNLLKNEFAKAKTWKPEKDPIFGIQSFGIELPREEKTPHPGFFAFLEQKN